MTSRSANVARVTLPRLHAAQLAILKDPARFKVIVTGRRFGKGVVSTVKAIQVAAGKGGKYWHISPDFPTSSVEWRLLKFMVKQLPDVTIREDERYIEFGNGGYIQVKSAQQTLRSEGLDGITVDEAAHIPDLSTIWNEALRPTLADHEGEAWFTSTPYGLNFFQTLYTYGLDPTRADWSSFRYASSANPFLKPEEIAAMRASMTERAARQEIDAEFIDDAGAVFRFVNEVSTLAPESGPVDGHRYVIGLDTGRSNDYTVASVFDATARRQVAMDRFSGVTWELQRARIKALNDRWRPSQILCEINSIGQPFHEALSRDGLPMQAFTTTADSKAQIIEGLSLAIERGYAGDSEGVHLLDDAVQKGELLAYALERLPSGKYRYSAPLGQHDDTVIATALAVYAGLDSRRFFVDIQTTAPAYVDSLPVLWAMSDSAKDQAGMVTLITQESSDGRTLTVIAEHVALPGIDYDTSITVMQSLGYPDPALIYVSELVSEPSYLRGRLLLKGLYNVGVQAVPIEAVRNLASMIAAGRVQVNPSCKGLLSSLGSFRLSDSGVLPVDNAVLALAALVYHMRFWEESPVAPAETGQVDPALASFVNFNRWFSLMLRQ